MATTIYKPPSTEIEPVAETLHGIEITDSYRWLEKGNSLRTQEWIEAQTRYAETYFDEIPNRTRIKTRVAELLLLNAATEPWIVGDRYFFAKRVPDAEQPAIFVKTGLNGPEQILVDPALRGTGPSTAVSIAAISDDGRFLAYCVRRAGTDHSQLEILDVDKKIVLPDGLPEGFCSSIVFAPDCSGFFYVNRRLDDPRPNYRAVLWHQFGTTHENDREVFSAGEASGFNLRILDAARFGYLAYVVSCPGKYRHTSLYFHSIQTSAAPRPLLEKIKGYFVPFFVRDQLLAYTDINAPNRRIVRIDCGTPAPEFWTEVVSESNQRIQQFAVAGDRLFITRVHRFSTIVESFDLEGKRQGNIAFPEHGTVDLLSHTTTSHKLVFSYTSITTPAKVYCQDLGTESEAALWHESASHPGEGAVSTEEVCYPSKDGTPIPLFLAAKKGLLHSGPLPTFLTGYGGFGTCVVPRFTAFSAFLIEQGFLLAIPALRGGSELGEHWHSAGKRDKRQNSFDDFIAAAEWLVREGRSAPQRIAIGGGSNAGLLVGAAITQRPELFRAAVCLGPLLDMIRFHLFDSAAGWTDEYGCPDDAQDFQFLLEYSPYHRVRDGVAYPATLLISGDADNRCNPLHARKMTARLQAANVSDHPILLDYNPNWGHTPVQPLSRKIEALTKRLAFVCNELAIKCACERSF